MKHCIATVLSELDGRLRSTYLSLRANVLARIDCIAKFAEVLKIPTRKGFLLTVRRNSDGIQTGQSTKGKMSTGMTIGTQRRMGTQTGSFTILSTSSAAFRYWQLLLRFSIAKKSCECFRCAEIRPDGDVELSPEEVANFRWHYRGIYCAKYCCFERREDCLEKMKGKLALGKNEKGEKLKLYQDGVKSK